MNGRCEDCRWWDTSSSHGHLQNASPCRVNPPVHDDRNSVGRWPFTDGRDWCARFELAVEPPAPNPTPGPRVRATDAALRKVAGTAVIEQFSTFAGPDCSLFALGVPVNDVVAAVLRAVDEYEEIPF